MEEQKRPRYQPDLYPFHFHSISPTADRGRVEREKMYQHK